MKRKISLLTTAVCLSLASSVAMADALRDRAAAMFEAIPQEPPVIRGNELNPEKVELGKMLFFEPRLSSSHLISCNTCHNVGFGGDDYLPVSIGHGWQQGPRNAPTVFNAVFNAAQFWDGRAADLAEQAMGPVQAGVEMASTPERVVDTLNSMPEYIDRFRASFPNYDDPVTFENMAFAIEAFEATLITPNSPFDLWLTGDDDAMTSDQKEGLALFMDKGCAACHAGVNFGGQNYFPFGLVQRPGAHILPEGDRGRFEVTQTATDDYVFRASPLRNIELTAPYFHSGSIWDLEEAVAVMGVAQLGAELNDQEVLKITEFLRALTGEIPRVVYPLLPVSTRETPRPVSMSEAPPY
ncbi:MAG: cytochrome-c peroxidase [Oceanospirillales bacterium]|nr:MAG: cytochrome-c peroxidase [Oceanospirillales bacterium]